jgi:predicted aldo/keto reductase-like oxidoreductase
MIYKTYGKTGKKVSPVGFGGMRFDTSRSREENAGLVRYAAEQGINYFDTAPGYCADQSEDIYGLAFRDMPAPFYCSTKAMPEKHPTAGKALDAVKRSRDRLGVEKIDFYHIWCLRKMDHYHLAVKPGGQYEGLLRAKDDGLIEHIVCSSHQPGPEIRRIVEDGKVEGVLMGINVLNFPYRWDGVQACRDAGLGVVAMNPLGGGLIPRNEDSLSFLAAEGESPTDAALRFNISCPQITVTLVGFTRREHIDQACRAADRARPFTDNELDALRTHLGEDMNAVCTGCGYCEGCPNHIPVPAYMQFYNFKQLFGYSDQEMRKRIDQQHNWQLLVGREAGAADCIECGQCEEKCTQHLNIIERLHEIARWEEDA